MNEERWRIRYPDHVRGIKVPKYEFGSHFGDFYVSGPAEEHSKTPGARQGRCCHTNLQHKCKLAQRLARSN